MPGGWDRYLEVCRPLENKLVVHLVNLHRKYGLHTVMSGMAAGWDTILARAAIRARKIVPLIKLHAVLPCREQEKKWSPHHQRIYREILEEVDMQTLIFDGTYEERPGCMLERNKYMVERADAILCYFDGLPYGFHKAEEIEIGRDRGGTRHCLRYATEWAIKNGISLPVYNYFCP